MTTEQQNPPRPPGGMGFTRELETQIVARHSPGVHDRVKRATVGIAGVGGLGSNAAVFLARLGVGTLIIADFDNVEPGNLNRQHYFIDQLNQPKTAALGETLERVNPFVTVIPHQTRLTTVNTPALFADADIMMECFDDPEAKAMAFECARTTMKHVPWVMASGLAGYGSAHTIRVRRIADNVLLVGDGESAAAPDCGLMAPRVNVCAATQANVVLRMLMGEEIA